MLVEDSCIVAGWCRQKVDQAARALTSTRVLALDDIGDRFHMFGLVQTWGVKDYQSTLHLQKPEGSGLFEYLR